MFLSCLLNRVLEPGSKNKKKPRLLTWSWLEGRPPASSSRAPRRQSLTNNSSAEIQTRFALTVAVPALAICNESRFVQPAKISISSGTRSNFAPLSAMLLTAGGFLLRQFIVLGPKLVLRAVKKNTRERLPRYARNEKLNHLVIPRFCLSLRGA